VASVPVTGLEKPNRPQEVFWRFVYDSANVDLLRLVGMPG
jgi:hypothetical protein